MTKFGPLKHLFNKTNLSRCLAKCMMLLTEFDLKFVSQKSIKDQALTDHLADAPSPLALPSNQSFSNDNVLKIELKTWELYFDGSKCRIGFGTRVILIPPIGKHIPLSYQLNLLCTNNNVEYKALLIGLRVALILIVKDIKIFGDSKLVI